MDNEKKFIIAFILFLGIVILGGFGIQNSIWAEKDKCNSLDGVYIDSQCFKAEIINLDGDK